MPSVPVPFAAPLSSRMGELDKGSLILNGYLSPDSAGGAQVHKRPGSTWVQETDAVGNGIYSTGNAFLYEIRGDDFYFNGTLIGTLTGSPGKCWFASTGPFAVPNILSFHGDNSYIYTWDGLTLTQTLVAGVVGGWVGGYVYLDGTFYAMDQAGNIRGSAFNDPTDWSDSTNNVIANLQEGDAIGIWSIMSYIVAFSTTTSSFFYDNGVNNPTGSPLAPSPANFQQVGCYDKNSVVKISDDIYFISADQSGYIRAMQLTGLQFKEVSSSDVNRILNKEKLTNVFDGTCIGWSTMDRRIYMVRIVEGLLVYDTKVAQWYFWAFYIDVENDLTGLTFTRDSLDFNTYTATYTPLAETPNTITHPFVFSTENGQYIPVQKWTNTTVTIRYPVATYGASFSDDLILYSYSSTSGVVPSNWYGGLLQGANSEIGVLNISEASDSYGLLSGLLSNPVYFMVRTESNDFGTQDLKSDTALDILGDRSSNSFIYVRNSDDDFQSIAGTVGGTLNGRYKITDLGSFQIRGFEVLNVDNTFFRLSGLRLLLTGMDEQNG